MKKSRQNNRHLSSHLYNNAYGQFVEYKQIFISGLIRGIYTEESLIDLKYTLKAGLRDASV